MNTSTATTDTESERAAVDKARLHRDRLARTQRTLREHQVPAALLCDPLNVRYAVTVGPFPVFNMHNTFRWALVFADSDPVLWEYPQSLTVTGRSWSGDLRPARSWTFFGSGPNTQRDTRAFAAEIASELTARGLRNEPLGIDRLETSAHLALTEVGLHIVDAQPAMELARAIKTEDELTALRTNAAICDQGIAQMLDRLRPAVTENELWSTLVGHPFSLGAEWCETRLLSSGPRTNPWMQETTNRPVSEGELIAFDTDMVGRHGYLTDVSRTYLCGDRRATDEQRRLYQSSYEFLHTCLPEFRAGASFEELGNRLGPTLPVEFRAQRYPFIAHGTGLVDEYPCVNFVDHHDGQLEPGMALSIESYIGTVGGSEGVKLEEQIIVTDGAPELISTAPFDERLLA